MESDPRIPTAQCVEDELIVAIRNGDMEKLSKTLVFGTVDLNDSELGCSLFINACETNNAAMVKLLVSHGVKPTKANYERRGHWAAVSPRTLDPFLVACSCVDDSTEIIEVLLDAGSDINAQDKRGFTGLIFACLADNVANVRVLIARGVDVNLEARGHESALVKTSYSQKSCSSRIMQMLLDAGADPYSLCGDAMVRCIQLNNIEGVTMLYRAFHGINLFDGDNWGDVLIELVQRSNILDSLDQFQEIMSSLPILHLSCAVPSHDPVWIVKKVLDMGADIHKRDDFGFSCLQFAVSSLHLETVRMLLDMGANATDDGWCPLWKSLPAVQKDNADEYLKVLQLLLVSGFKLDEVSAQMFTLAVGESDIPKEKRAAFQNVMAQYSESVGSLKDTCRMVVRRCIQSNVGERIETLSEDLPCSVRHFLTLADI